jgi:hypothetical protein
VLVLAGSAAWADPITNGGFETTTPPVTAGTCSTYGPGSLAINGWTTVGPQVAVCNTTFPQGGVLFVSEEGSNWLDLTGISSNSDLEGVQQSVATIAGDSYTLSFFIGNVNNTNALGFNFGVTSTVDVFANGISIGSFTNSCVSCTTTQGWQPFSTTFVANSPSTTLFFRNADPSTDNDNGLDNVVLTDNGPSAVAAVPEPTTIVLGSAGLIGAGVRRWRQRRA